LLKEVKRNFQLNIYPDFINDGIYNNVLSDITQKNYVQQFFLAYCEFDKAELYAVNEQAVEEIKKAFINGKKIEIIPLFDFLGTDEHNQRLALERANSALKLLGLKKEDVIITIPDDYFFSNDLPYGRMMNRTVIVRINNSY